MTMFGFSKIKSLGFATSFGGIRINAEIMFSDSFDKKFYALYADLANKSNIQRKGETEVRSDLLRILSSILDLSLKQDFYDIMRTLLKPIDFKYLIMRLHNSKVLFIIDEFESMATASINMDRHKPIIKLNGLLPLIVYVDFKKTGRLNAMRIMKSLAHEYTHYIDFENPKLREKEFAERRNPATKIDWFISRMRNEGIATAIRYKTSNKITIYPKEIEEVFFKLLSLASLPIKKTQVIRKSDVAWYLTGHFYTVFYLILISGKFNQIRLLADGSKGTITNLPEFMKKDKFFVENIPPEIYNNLQTMLNMSHESYIKRMAHALSELGLTHPEQNPLLQYDKIIEKAKKGGVRNRKI